MQCETFHDRLDALLDRRESPDGDLELVRHADSCSHCGEHLAMTIHVLEALTQGNHPGGQGPSPSSQRHASTVSDQSTLPFVRWAIAVAATLLIAAGMWSQWSSGGTQIASAPTESASADVEVIAAVPSATTLISNAEPMIPDDEAAGATFVHQPLLSLGLLSRADWATVRASSERQLAISFTDQFPELDAKWMELVSDGITPVKQSMDSTLDLLRRSLIASS